jgi:aspartate/methionine/tyrosine aminotransferase
VGRRVAPRIEKYFLQGSPVNFETYPFEKLIQLLADIEPDHSYSPMSLTIGEPQFETPGFIREALCDASALLNKYPKTAGEADLKEAMLSYLHQRFGLELEADQLIPTFGTRELLFNFPQFLLHDNASPTMAFPNPFYQIYEGAAIAAGAEILHLDLTPENGFLPPLDEAALADCDLVILNTPNNPTASVMPFDEMVRWVELALKHGFVLLNDECYIDLWLEKPLPSILEASVAAGNPEFRKVLAVNSASKRSSAPGLRSGFIAGDREILAEYLRYRTYVGCASPLPLQRAAAVAWEDQEHVEGFRAKYRRNFELAREILGAEPPEATFYIWLEVDDELAFTRELYRRYNLKVLPGSFLGRHGVGEGFVRLALVYEEEPMREALERLAAFRSGEWRVEN